jgi:glycosyltransferase involved in cell wall biosynthesis
VRVLWLTERFPPERGGAAISAERQTRALSEALEGVDVLRLTSELSPARVTLEQSGRRRVFHVGRAAESDESLQILLQTALNLRAVHGHALIHGFFAVHAGYVATMAARLAGVPSVVSLRGNDVDRAMFHGPRLPFLTAALARADALMGVSHEILRKVQALTGREHGLSVVPNSVDAALFAPGPPARDDDPALAGASRPFLAFAGELRLKKGLPLLQDLASRLAASGRGTLFWIGGVREEEQRGVLAWRRADPGAAARVREVPYVRERERLLALYRAMDLFVFPSLWEGMPNALLESMACAKPALACAIGACPELIDDGVSGFLLAPERLETFPEAALALIERGPEALARVGAAARERVRRDFTPQAERDALLGVYRTLVMP